MKELINKENTNKVATLRYKLSKAALGAQESDLRTTGYIQGILDAMELLEVWDMSEKDREKFVLPERKLFLKEEV